jgi:drug/metabolite transporter (DMT)-like permease
VPAEQAMGLALGATVVVVGMIALATGPVDAITFPLAHVEIWPMILVSGLLSGAGAAVLFTMGIRLISRVRAGILGLIEPIVGTLAAAVLLAQVLSPVQLLGGALVLGSAVLIQRDTEDASVSDRAMVDEELAPVALV